MNRRTLCLTVASLLGVGHRCAKAQTAAVVVIGHPGLEKINVNMVQRIFTGRVVEVGGQAVTPVNVVAGSAVRAQFLQTYLQQDEDKYIAYWTVRRYIGKGVPPRELNSPDEVLRFVAATPGAIGYVPESSIAAGVNILLR